MDIINSTTEDTWAQQEKKKTPPTKKEEGVSPNDLFDKDADQCSRTKRATMQRKKFGHDGWGWEVDNKSSQGTNQQVRKHTKRSKSACRRRKKQIGRKKEI